MVADAGDDDEGGYIGYVVQTVDPGPILLIATLCISFFLLATLPFVVILGDKYEELEKRTVNSDTSDDYDDQDESKQDQQKTDKQQHIADDSSVSSRRSYYSAVSGAVKGVLDIAGKPIRSGSRQRHRRRYRGQLDKKQLLNDPSQYSIELTNVRQPDPEYSSPYQRGATTLAMGTLKEDPPGYGVSESPEPSLFDGQESESSVSQSQYGEVELELKVEMEKAQFNRGVCLTVDGFLDEIAAIMAWDVEMKRILKLSIPFATQAIFTGTLDTLTVGVVGKLIGTREVSAFVVVVLLVELTTKFVGGFHEALATLCSQAIGAGKMRLAGKYFQISLTLYLITYIPFALLWYFFLDDAIRWFGFDEQTVEMGYQYGKVLLVDYMVYGVTESVHGLLDVGGHENYGTTIGCCEELTSFLVILTWALVGNPTLLVVGLVQFSVGTFFLSLNCLIIWWKGWFLPYRAGMLGTFALADKKAVRMVFKTAMSLSFGYLLTDGEWEVLTIFASFLGPAEVAAWGIFGTIWDAINELLDGICGASEVRCAFLLGSGQPERARLSAYKSLMISTFTSLFTTSILFMCGESLPTWLTNDPTLQHLLNDLLPMFGLGNAAMCLGSMSWTLLGAQGRYRLATVVVFIVSWLFTLPVAAVLSVHLNINLQGQTAAVVLGYIIAGTIHAYFLFRSDWFALSETVMDDNCSRASDDDSSLKDTPTKSDDIEEMSTNTPSKEEEEIEFVEVRQEESLAVCDDLPKSSSGTALFQHGAFPSPARGEGLPPLPTYYEGGLPNPPSGEGPGLLGSGWLHTSPSEDIEVDFYKGIG